MLKRLLIPALVAFASSLAPSAAFAWGDDRAGWMERIPPGFWDHDGWCGFRGREGCSGVRPAPITPAGEGASGIAAVIAAGAAVALIRRLRFHG